MACPTRRALAIYLRRAIHRCSLCSRKDPAMVAAGEQT